MSKVLVKNISEIDDIDLSGLICPLFVISGQCKKERIPSMPGIHRFSIDRLIEEVGSLNSLGLNKYLLFGVPSKKSWMGSEAYDDKNIVAEAIKKLKANYGNINLFTDVCLCAYTSHGHCGIIKKGQKTINAKETLKALSRMALVHAHAGADYVAPSAMANGQVAAIRDKLDLNGFYKAKIMGYSAKFASNFYGPFRAIANSSPAFGDRRGYQLDCKDLQAALDKVKEDIEGGADIVMVKPAIGYLDVVSKVKGRFDKPLAVYNVSGEYAFVKQGMRSGLWKERDVVSEIFSSFKRAGADLIITYHAKDIALWQNRQ